MSPEAQFQEPALHGFQQAEALRQTAEALHQHVEVTPHIQGHHEHDGHDHHIEIREAHACTPDCPEHGAGHHDHSTNEHHHGHEHGQEAHTIQRKAPEHACSADCPEHGGGHHNHTMHHDHHERKEGHHISPKIEHKAHACTADCPEHSHAPPTHHEHKGEASHDIVQKAAEHACTADCPEHGHNKHHDHRHEHHDEIGEKAESPIKQQAEVSRMQHLIEEELRTRQPQPSQTVKQQTPPEAVVGRQAAQQATTTEHTVRETVAAPAREVALANEQAEPNLDAVVLPRTVEEVVAAEPSVQTVDAEVAPESQPTFPATMYTEMAVEADGSAMDQIAGAAATDSQEKALSELDATNLPLSQSAAEHYIVEQRETVFDIPAMLAELPVHAPTQPAESIQAEHTPMPLAVIPELPATSEPLNRAVATVAETVVQRYQSVAEALGAEESDIFPLSPVQISELRTILTVMQARAIRPENLAMPSTVMPQEFVRLLQLLGFENPAKTFEKHIGQYGYVFYEELLAQLFQLLHHAKPVEAPILQASSVTTVIQADWTAALGKAAVLLVMLARQFIPSRALHLAMEQTESAVS